MDTSVIQGSLIKDLRDTLLTRRAQPRAEIERFCKILAHASISELTMWNKEFTTQLCSDPYGGEKFSLQGSSLILAGDPELIRALRQTLGFFSRLHANVTKDMELAQLIEAKDRLTAKPEISWTTTEVAAMRRFISRILGKAPTVQELTPRHGPGAVATGEKGFEKLYFKEVYQKWCDAWGKDEVMSLFRLPNQPQMHLSVLNGSRTKVVAVPKDALHIRTISCEPLSMMFLQQGLMHEMYNRMCGRRWGAHFPFQNQALQQMRACLGSQCQEWGRPLQHCTIDLSSASDDVRLEHVRLLFSEDWFDLLSTLRSDYAHFPQLGYGVEMTTFAPMGAATCYPVESLVFAAVRHLAEMKNTSSYKNLFRDWGVCGDDIVTSAAAYETCLDLLVRGGFHPNVSKSCGPAVRFRESCGGDFFEGVDVTYVRPRVLPNEHRLGATVPMVQIANGLLARGFRQTAQLFARNTPGPVALGYGPSYADPRLDWRNKGRVRWETSTQQFEQKTVVEKPLDSPRLGAVEGWEPVFNWFTSRWHDDSFYSSRTRLSYAWLPIEAADARNVGYQPKSHTRSVMPGYLKEQHP